MTRPWEQPKKPRIRQGEQPVGRFALMRHTGDAKRAHFTVWRDTADECRDEAARLLAQLMMENPSVQQTFYVVQVRATYSGGPNGWNSSES